MLILVATLSGLILAGARMSLQDGRVDLPTLSVDVNSAPEPVLGALPGLGPTLSRRIIETRAVRAFPSMDDFDRRVYGIGPAKVAGLRPFLRFDLEPTSVSVP